MTDAELITLLSHLTDLHRKSKPTNNTGPRFDDDCITIEEEQFAAWLGWRGQEAQETACNWPAEDLASERRERLDRDKGELQQENRELRACLRSIQGLIGRRFSKG